MRFDECVFQLASVLSTLHVRGEVLWSCISWDRKQMEWVAWESSIPQPNAASDSRDTELILAIVVAILLQ